VFILFTILGILAATVFILYKKNLILSNMNKETINMYITNKKETDELSINMEKKIYENISYKQRLLEIDLNDVVTEQMEIVTKVSNAKSGLLKKSSKDIIIDAIDILEQKKISIARDLQKIRDESPKPFIIKEVGLTMGVGASEYLNSLIDYSFTNLLDIMDIEEKVESKNARLAKHFFGDLIEEADDLSDKNIVFINRTKH
jgi:hypothetical protein